MDLVLAKLVGLRHVEVAAVAEEPRFRNDFLKGGKNRHVSKMYERRCRGLAKVPKIRVTSLAGAHQFVYIF